MNTAAMYVPKAHCATVTATWIDIDRGRKANWFNWVNAISCWILSHSRLSARWSCWVGWTELNRSSSKSFTSAIAWAKKDNECHVANQVVIISGAPLINERQLVSSACHLDYTGIQGPGKHVYLGNWGPWVRFRGHVWPPWLFWGRLRPF